MKRIIVNIIILSIFLTGLGVLLYPAVSDYVNKKNASRAIAAYEQSVGEMEEAGYTQNLLDAASYNEYIASFASLGGATTMEEEREDSPYEELLNVSGTGMMGSIRIPCIKVECPIYHGTSEAVLQVAVGHYQGSSLPIGGESTHAILTGHRGLPSARLFTDLDRLEEGDIFYIKVLGDILEYQIDQIQTVLPEEVDSLGVVLGEDYVTLVTCTPYGINSHRMLIRGTRIPYDGGYEEEVAMKPAPIDTDVPEEQQGNGFTTRQWVIFGALAFGASIGTGLLIPSKKSGGKGKGQDGKTGKREEDEKISSSSMTEKKEGSHDER
ncbi:MAG: class C sortase [Lachnospiraceae bacterium]|nr:class C sortase [Lachnospiraceae bacterium]